MRVILTYQDLAAFGIVPVTMTHGPIAFRTPFDLTAAGKLALQMAFDVSSLALHEPCSPGPRKNPHVGSIMLAEGMLPFLALFALLHDGAEEVFLTADRRWWGLYREEPRLQRDMFLEYYRDDILVHFGRGTKLGWLSDYRSQNALD
jgi:hypothetical protein